MLLVGLGPSFGSCFTVVQYFYLLPPHPRKETVIVEGIVNCKLMRSCSVMRLCMETELSSYVLDSFWRIIHMSECIFNSGCWVLKRSHSKLSNQRRRVWETVSHKEWWKELALLSAMPFWVFSPVLLIPEEESEEDFSGCIFIDTWILTVILATRDGRLKHSSWRFHLFFLMEYGHRMGSHFAEQSFWNLSVYRNHLGISADSEPLDLEGTQESTFLTGCG